MPRVSVIIPTLNEAENVDPLLRAVLEHGRAAPLELEVIVVDDGSSDGTRERVRAWEGAHPVRLLAREGGGGLAGAVLAGAAEARGEVVVVMDADLSHPPERIAELARPVLDGSRDVVIGSRHVPGGGAPGWPLRRKLISGGAAALAWLFTDARDPMSGFFAARRERLLETSGGARGFKIGLELLARGGEALRVAEAPITFRDRVRGRSKLSGAVVRTYLGQLAALAGGAVSTGNLPRFLLAGLAGLAVDYLLFQALLAAGFALGAAHVASFLAAAVVNHALNARWAIAPGKWDGSSWQGYASLLVVWLMALFLRGGVLASCVTGWGWPPRAAILPAIAAAAAVSHLGCAFFVFSRPPSLDRGIRWRVASAGVILYLFVLRLVHPGLGNPGVGEPGGGLGAVASWSAALVFSFLLARNLFGKSVALRSAMLAAALPFFFAAGGRMPPDSPLLLYWAGALYFLERALVAGRRQAFWGAGACLGLGMLSGYSMALLGLAALGYLLIDPRSRRWLLRPEPCGTGPCGMGAAGAANQAPRARLFLRVFTMVPLLVLAAASLRGETSEYWTGPVWLAALPLLARSLAGSPGAAGRWTSRAVERAWKPVLLVLLSFHVAWLHFPVPGLPGVRFPESHHAMSWRASRPLPGAAAGGSGEEAEVVEVGPAAGPGGAGVMAEVGDP